MKKKKFFNKYSIFDIIVFTVLITYSIFLIVIVLWGMMTSVKSFDEFRVNVAFLPKKPIWDWEWGNFGIIYNNLKAKVVTTTGQIKYVGVLEQFYNTLIYAGIGGLVATIVPFIMAYMVSTYNYFMSKIIYGIVIVTMILPIVGSYPSEMEVLNNLKMYDTMWGLILQGAHFLGIYFLVFYGQFKTVPKDYYEAAHVDGASEFKTMTRVIMPMFKDTFYAVFLIKFIERWNNYQTVLLYLPSRPTLVYGLYRQINNTQGDLNTIPMRMASVVILIVPILILVLVFRKRIFRDISMEGGIKG